MGRAFFETIALFVAPFALFAIYLALRLRYPLAIEHWTRGRLSWLTLAGLFAVALGLFLADSFAPRAQGRYVPAYVEKGVLTQGHFE